MLLKQLIIALLLVSQLLPFQARANESQSHKLRAGPVYKNNDNSYGVVIELPLIIEVSSLTTHNTKLSIIGEGIGASQIKSFKNSGEKLAWLLCIDVSGSGHTGLARSRRRRPIQPVVGQPMPSACFLHEVQKAGELREYQGAVPLIAQDLEPLHQETELGGGLIGLLRQEAGRKTDLPQFEDSRERDKLGLPGSLGAIGVVDR